MDADALNQAAVKFGLELGECGSAVVASPTRTAGSGLRPGLCRPARAVPPEGACLMNWDWVSFWSYVGGLISYALLIIVLGLVSSLLATNDSTDHDYSQ
jgi:hypothetical protein